MKNSDSQATKAGASGRALVIHPHLKSRSAEGRAPEARLEEARGLAEAIGLEVRHGEVVVISSPPLVTTACTAPSSTTIFLTPQLKRALPPDSRKLLNKACASDCDPPLKWKGLYSI